MKSPVQSSIADGCSGQNKNTTIIGMASKFFKDYAPKTVQSLPIVYPVVGHSFLPADRVFAKIEKNIKKLEVISNPDEYYQIFRKHGSVFKMGTEVKVSSWKEAASGVLKTTTAMHFPFKKSKRFFLKGVKIKIMC